MTALELARQVKAVRRLQRATRERMTHLERAAGLSAADRAERELDRLLDEILADRPAMLTFKE